MSTPAPTQQQPDYATIKQRQQKVWSNGHYEEIGARLVIMSELLAEAANVRSGQKVLDVASGSGNAAIAAARRFAEVTSTDYVPELLEVGRRRAMAENLPITFEVADAEALPYADNSFDVVMSAIGSMFAPNQRQAAAELVRVTRPGGTIALANWTPDSFAGDLFRTAARYNPPPPGLSPPTYWGTEDGLHDLFGAAARFTKIQRRDHMFRFLSPAHLADFFAENFGPIRSTLGVIDAENQASLLRDLQNRVEELNVSGDDSVVVASGYLEVVAIKS